MTNPADWGGTPLANSAVRGVLSILFTGILYSLYAWQKGIPWQGAVVEGAIPMLLMFIAFLGGGVMDQNRAKTGVVNPADVPVQIETKLEPQTKAAMADMPNLGPVRTAQQMAKDWTLAYKAELNDYGR